MQGTLLPVSSASCGTWKGPRSVSEGLRGPARRSSVGRGVDILLRRRLRHERSSGPDPGRQGLRLPSPGRGARTGAGDEGGREDAPRPHQGSKTRASAPGEARGGRLWGSLCARPGVGERPTAGPRQALPTSPEGSQVGAGSQGARPLGGRPWEQQLRCCRGHRAAILRVHSPAPSRPVLEYSRS